PAELYTLSLHDALPILTDMGVVAQRDVLAALSDQLGVPLVTIDGPPPAAPEIDGLSHRFLRQCRAFPIAVAESALTVAMADPMEDRKSTRLNSSHRTIS